MEPAVYKPADVIVPPVAEYVTDTDPLEPLLNEPETWNCCVAPVCRLTVAGVNETDTSVGGGGGGGGGAAVIVTLEVSAGPVSDVAITRNEPAVEPAV